MYVRLFAVAVLVGVSGCVTPMQYGAVSSETALGGWNREPTTNQPTDCTTTVTKTGQPIPGTLEIHWEGGTARQVCVAKSDPGNTPNSQVNKQLTDLNQNVDGVNQNVDGVRNLLRSIKSFGDY